tara:strand:- start:89 stop:448 length:360 start_codon:yes stop_codon:yes gene_type:complete
MRLFVFFLRLACAATFNATNGVGERYDALLEGVDALRVDVGRLRSPVYHPTDCPRLWGLWMLLVPFVALVCFDKRRVFRAWVSPQRGPTPRLPAAFPPINAFAEDEAEFGAIGRYASTL